MMLLIYGVVCALVFVSFASWRAVLVSSCRWRLPPFCARH